MVKGKILSATAVDSGLDERIEAVRRFNRFYSERFEVLNERLLESEFSLTEARVLYELAHRENVTATELARDLKLDMGYLSRMLSKFESEELILKKQSLNDGRQTIISLTRKGRGCFGKLNTNSRQQLSLILSELPVPDQKRLVSALATAHSILSLEQSAPTSYILRPPEPGDFGWIVQRHGELYAQEYGWNEKFEGLVADIVGQFVQNFDPVYERCWIAEADGERAGCAFVVKESATIGKFRLLLVEPKARKLGIGSRLVNECIRFARTVGYKNVNFWTNNVLKDARRIYDRMGFTLVHEERHSRFGPELVGQTFEKDLS